MGNVRRKWRSMPMWRHPVRTCSLMAGFLLPPPPSDITFKALLRPSLALLITQRRPLLPPSCNLIEEQQLCCMPRKRRGGRRASPLLHLPESHGWISRDGGGPGSDGVPGWLDCPHGTGGRVTSPPPLPLPPAGRSRSRY